MNDFNSYNYIGKSSNNISKIYNDEVIRQDIIHLYRILSDETNFNSDCFYNRNIVNLYNEWLMEIKNSNIDGYTKAERNHFLDYYYLIDSKNIDFYKFIFSVHTYFCMVIKLLVARTLKQVDNDVATNKISWSELSSLFLNSDSYFSEFTDGFFDVDYYAWFVSVELRHTDSIRQIAETILNKLQLYDVSKNLYYPKRLREQLVNLYSLFVPFGEVGFCETSSGEDFLSVLDYKISLSSSNDNLGWVLSKKIGSNLIGFSSDKISLLITKSIYILTIFYKTSNFNLKEPFMLKIYPMISKSFRKFDFNYELGSLKVTLKTYVGDFVIPLSSCFRNDILLFEEMSKFLDCKRGFSSFWPHICKKIDNVSFEKDVVNKLYEDLMLLRTPIQYDFWCVYIKNKITPLLIKL